MKKLALISRTMILLMTSMLLFAPFACAGAEGFQSAEEGVPSHTPRLPRTVTEYSMDFETKEWQPVRSWSYT